MTKNAFVLMPFAEEFSDVYQYLICESLTSVGYRVTRADDIKSQNNILADIVEGIVASELIVADLTGANPNVYYELGIAHALDKNVILLAQEISDLPFDLRSYRVVAYSTHFAKMNQSRKELMELAAEAYQGALPFGNPVRDFVRETPGREWPSVRKESVNAAPESEWGFLDYRIKLEEGFEELGGIVSTVGEKLDSEVTPQITKSGEKLNSGRYSTKQQRNIVQELAGYLQSYGAFVKPKNERYRSLLKELETGLERLLSEDFAIGEDGQGDLPEFIELLSSVEQAAFEGRQGFASLIDTMNSLPKIEKSFNRSKAFMAEELNAFVDNIDQTIAILERAKRMAKVAIQRSQSE